MRRVPPPRAQPPSAQQAGQVVASFGRSYRVELEDGTLIECATRGKRSDVTCGDRVTVLHSGDNSGVIEPLCPRATLLYRSDAYKQKLIAANVTQAVIVIAPAAGFSACTIETPSMPPP